MDMCGLMLEVQNKLSVVVACFIIWHHKCIGICGSHEYNVVMKWSLKVPIVFSAVLLQWRFGGIS